ncbi:alanine racemase [Paenibacillus popilliae]|uniref:Alanine racemase n=1 Tax=Paenibacillus popilliae ATCC 14706 TaxID=1212764 RepID=M9LGP7_PAEPP|nr:alanine racemase [Paenibacillus popilliae]GAC41770.1 alanine racemase [Paenibacillus popilliae ATCC 14706]
MEAYYRPTRAEISLDALRHNMEAFRAALPSATKLSVCVKANAYGHGAVEIARAAERFGADYVNVAFLDEAVQLRRADVQMPILILGYTPPAGIEAAFEHDISLTVCTEECIRKLEEAAPGLSTRYGGRLLKVHVKTDTGMGRLGLRTPEYTARCVRRLQSIDGILVEGVFTHFAGADEKDQAYSCLQQERFEAVIEELKRQELTVPLIHASNSAAAMELPESAYDMVRVGISAYGLYPSADVHRQRIQLRPVLSLKTAIVHAKTVPAGEAISYGMHYYTSAEERIATIPVGYADGYSRMLSGKAHMLIRGRRVPVLGSICMDQCMVSLEPLGEDGSFPEPGEEVILLGEQGEERITAEEIAEHIGTLHYEVVCMVAYRMPRLYIESGKPVKVINPLLQAEAYAEAVLN